MIKQNPCLIFSDDGYLCDEVDVLSSLRGAYDMNTLRDSFDAALGDQLHAFRSFCSTPSTGGSRYRIFRLTGFFKMEYAFCEKNTIMSCEYTHVFLAEEISQLYRYMTPEAFFTADTASRIIYELLYLRGKREFERVSMTPEAFLVAERVPNLTSAILSDCKDHYCDICAVTELILSCFSGSPLYEDVKVTFSLCEPTPMLRRDNSFICLPLEAFVTLVLLQLSIAVALSEDRAADITLTKMSASADVTVCVHSDLLDRECTAKGIDGLSDISYTVDSFVRIASVIAMMFGIRVSYSYCPVSRLLSIHTVIGGEPTPAADFKFTDPTAEIKLLSADILSLVNTIN